MSLFAALSGHVSPAQGIWVAAMVSAGPGRRLPGRGTIPLEQTARFLVPAARTFAPDPRRRSP